MNVRYIAYADDGAILHAEIAEVADWQEACARGMGYRNALVGDGIVVKWWKV